MIHHDWFDEKWVIDAEEGKKMVNWAIFELLMEKDTEDDKQSDQK